MKPKTEMRIGFWGIIFLMIFFITSFIYTLFYKPSNLDNIESIGSSFTFIVFTIYVFSIMRKDLKTTNLMCRFWVFSATIVLLFVSFVLLASGKWLESFLSLVGSFIFFLSFLIPYLLIKFILMTGLKGLQRIIDAEKELNIENTSLAEEKAGDL